MQYLSDGILKQKGWYELQEGILYDYDHVYLFGGSWKTRQILWKCFAHIGSCCCCCLETLSRRLSEDKQRFDMTMGRLVFFGNHPFHGCFLSLLLNRPKYTACYHRAASCHLIQPPCRSSRAVQPSVVRGLNNRRQIFGLNVCESRHENEIVRVYRF